MSAMYWVDFKDGKYLTVYSADAKNMTQKALREAYRKARKKAEAMHRRKFPELPKSNVTSVRCVG